MHSPFAFNFIRDVVFERGEYYAYASLRAKRHYHDRPERDLRLLFRLANAHRSQTATIFVDDQYNDTTDIVAYLRAARPRINFYDASEHIIASPRHLLLLLSPDWHIVANAYLPQVQPHSLLIVSPITGTASSHWRTLCSRPEVRVCFDLHDFGIVFFNPDHNPEVHKVNRAF